MTPKYTEMFTLSQRFHSYFIVLITSIIALSNRVYAQERINLDQSNKPPFMDRLFYGGSLGLQFGNVTLVDISPMIGYKLSKRVGFGISPTYKYYGYKYLDYTSGTYMNEKTNVFGGSLFARAIVYQNIFAHAEYEYLTYKTKDPLVTSQNISNEFNSVLVGPGYREAIGRNAYMNLLILWNLNETIDSPYTNPIIRVGFSIGF